MVMMPQGYIWEEVLCLALTRINSVLVCYTVAAAASNQIIPARFPMRD